MDGYQIALIVISVLLVLAGGYIKLLSREVKELFSTISEALQDNKITPEELSQILKEGKDVKDVIMKIAYEIGGKLP